MHIPFYGIKRFYEKNSREILDVVHSVYSDGMHFGEETEKLENELCKITGRKYAVTVNSCTDALFFALKSANIKENDEVLVTSFSFIASVSPILRAGAIPVFIDINPRTYLMDIEDAENKITEKTKAVISVDLFGQALNINELEQIAKKNHLFLIEDAAQGLGAKSGNRVAGSMGTVSCLSFDPTKVISAFGSGGAVLTDDEKIFKLVKQLRYHGKGETDDFGLQGYNCRLASSQCALLTYQLKEHLSKRIHRLRDIASLYNNAFGINNDIIIPESPAENFHIYHKYVLQTKSRDKVKGYLNEKGIETMIHYPKPLYEFSLFSKHRYKAEGIAICKEICNHVLSLPVYPELTDEELDYICKAIKNII